MLLEPGADPEFLERGIIHVSMKVEGFHRIFKNAGRGEGSNEPPELPLDPPLGTVNYFIFIGVERAYLL